MRLIGIISAVGTQDEDGYRTFTVKYKIESLSTEGTNGVMECPGVPTPGATYAVQGDVNNDAYRKIACGTKMLGTEEKNTHWELTVTFSSKPDGKRCKDQSITDPLQIPPRVSGNFAKYQEEATVDFFGLPIVNSAWEQIRGPQVEFDSNRPSIKIELNVADFAEVILAYLMCDTLNDRVLWGFNPRCIKLSNVHFDVKYYGQCYKYYVVSLDFDVRKESFDRLLLDEGTKVLHGQWSGDEYVVTNIGGINTPGPPALALVEGGSFANGIYEYRVSALNDAGETLASGATQIQITGGTKRNIRVSWALVPGAKLYHVFGRTPGAPQTFDVAGVTGSFLDDGTQIPHAPGPPVTDTTGGVVPSPSNPQHFIKFKDKKGELAHVILNGAGLPAGVVSPGHNVFISILDGNVGVPLTNTTAWRPVNGAPVPTAWDEFTQYVAGDLVTDEGITYLALLPVTGLLNGPPTAPFWLLIARGPVNAGLYDNSVSYSVGDFVTQPTTAGKILVTKYGASNFLLLGIPTVL